MRSRSTRIRRRICHRPWAPKAIGIWRRFWNDKFRSTPSESRAACTRTPTSRCRPTATLEIRWRTMTMSIQLSLRRTLRSRSTHRIRPSLLGWTKTRLSLDIKHILRQKMLYKEIWLVQKMQISWKASHRIWNSSKDKRPSDGRSSRAQANSLAGDRQLTRAVHPGWYA